MASFFLLDNDLLYLYVCTLTMYTVNSISEYELILECFSYTVPVTSIKYQMKISHGSQVRKKVLFTSFIIVAYQ